MPTVARQVRAKKLTYLSEDRLLSIANELRRIRRLGIPGDFYELGIALGGGSIFIASELDGNRRFKGFDVFGMIPPPTDDDEADTHERYRVIVSRQSEGIGGDPYYGYVDDLYERVTASFAGFGHTVDGDRISLHKGLFQDTLNPASADRIAFAHIDCDWFDPVLCCMSRLAPALSAGGTIIVDDYNDYAGCRKAVDQHMARDETLSFERKTPHAVIRKLGTR